MSKQLTTTSSSIFSQYNSDFAKSLNAVFYWYNDVFATKIIEASQKFLNADLGLKLVSISEKDNFFFSDNEFFVTKIKFSDDVSMFCRISSDMMSAILDLTLGKRDAEFAPDMITELEAKLLTAYNNYLHKNIESLFEINEDCDNENQAHFTFITKFFDQYCGKLVISVPIFVLPKIKHKRKQSRFDLNSFPDMCVELNLCAGVTQMTLKDLKSLERDDLVILEKSSVKTMSLKFNGKSVDFNIIPNPKIIENIGNLPEGENNMNFNAGPDTNMWDVIPVDVCAEFEKVKMTLGEIKAISEGSTIDVGSVYENKIYLKVESKIVAEGELVIINDKYAVRVTNVLGGNEQQNGEPTNIRPVADSVQNTFDGIPEYSDNNDNFDDNTEFDGNNEFNDNNDNESENFDNNDFDIEDENI